MWRAVALLCRFAAFAPLAVAVWILRMALKTGQKLKDWRSNNDRGLV